MMNIYSISSIIASVICWLLGALTYLNNRNDIKNKSFSLLLISIGIWTLFPFVTSIAADNDTALFYGRLVYIFALFTPPNFYLAISIILEIQNQKKNKIITKIAYLVSLLFLPFSFSNLLITNVKRFMPNFFVSPGILYPVFILFFGVICLFTFYNLYSVYKKSSGVFKNQVKYVFVGFAVAFIGGIFHVCSPYINVEIIPHDFFIILFSIIISYAIIYYRLMDINIAIRKTTTNILIVIIASILIVLVHKAAINDRIKITGFVVICISLSLFLPKFKQKIENLIIHILHKGKYDYLDKLEKFIENMALIPKEGDLISDTLKVLTRDMYIDKAGLFARDPITGDYLIKQNSGIDIPKDFKIPCNSGIVQWLKNHKEVFVLEEEEKRMSAGEAEEIKKGLEPLEARVFVPALLETDLLGIISLGSKSTGEMYTHIDLDLLQRMGLQLGAALDYKRIEAELSKKQEFSAIGQMAMEIAHEIKNMLVPIKTFFELLPERYNDPEFMKTQGGICGNSVNVMDNKVFDILYFAQDRLPEWKKDMDLIKVLEMTITGLEVKAKHNNITIVKEFSAIPAIVADNRLMSHIFTNLILNAIEAMKNEGGRITIKTSVHNNITDKMRQQSKEWIRIETKDTGPGIPENVKAKLFTAFVTTKSSAGQTGTGLGLTVVKKIIDSHRGYIMLDSEEGKGTNVIVDLPVRQKTTKEEEETVEP